MLAIRKLECKTAVFLLCLRMQSLVKREVIYPEMCATTKIANLAKIRQRFAAIQRCPKGPYGNFDEMTNLAKICRRLSKNSNEMFKEATRNVAILTNMGKIAERMSQNFGRVAVYAIARISGHTWGA